jgi:hypothetical protein
VGSSPRLRWWLSAALAVHGLVFAWVNRPAKPAEGAPTGPPMEIEVNVEAPPTPVPATVVEPGPALASRETPTNQPRVRAAQGAASSPSPEAPAPSAEPAASGSWTFSPTSVAPGEARLSGAALDDAVHAGTRETVAEGRRDPLKPNVGGFSQHDIELGLVPGGELVSLTRDTVRTSDAPTVGNAMLEFEIDAAGAMVSAHVLDASSDWERWVDVAKEIVKAARARPSKTARGGRGFALKLQVSSAIKTIGGLTPTDSPVTKVLRVLRDPLDAIAEGAVPQQRVVAARIIDVEAL